MAYLNFQNCTKQEYETVLYSQGSQNKIKITFNNVELQNADLFCEKFTVKPRIIPNGSKSFSLNSLVAKEAELILHDIDTSIIQDQIVISIGTFVNDTYEYVPIGIFNIQDTPTNDKNKTTIKLRDNASKFDFNYNAKPLIDAHGGSATKLQILQDICSEANVSCAVVSFMGASDLIGIYDNTITARQYVADLAESAGAIASINRDGELIFVYLNDLTTWKIPLNIVEKYNLGKPYKIGRVVYEDGTVRFETPESEYDTLYLDASNPYIANQTQVEDILTIVNNFEIDSFTTGNILGNPAIDGYDLIEIYGYYEDLPNGNKTFVADDETIVARTLATCELKYNGVITNTFDTQIEEEQRQQNISVIGEPTFKKWVKTEINNVEGTLTTTVGQVGEQNEKISQITQTVNEINAKISDISDITTSGETSYANLSLIDVNESNPISIKVRPIGENICYLYPYTTLYPSSTTYLKSRTLRFTNTSTSEVFEWVLPTDLWYYSETIYDELELSYGDGENAIVTVTRKCQINADNTVSVLSTPTTETYDYPMDLILTTGDYTIQLLGYTSAYLYVQLMASNIYTTQFATKVELNSSINQTATEINARVSLKLDSAEFTHASIVAKINDNTSQILIDADKIDISATDVLNILANNTLNLTSKNIAISSTNFSVDASGHLTCTGASIQGVLTAGNGSSIGGWTATANQLSSGSSSQYVALNSSTSNTYAIWAGNASGGSAPFRVTRTGVLYASGMTIAGSSTITGTLTCSGTISGGTISGSAISGGSISGATISGGSISITKGSYYFNMGTSTSHPNCSGLNVGFGGVNVNGLGLNSDGSTFTIAGGVNSAYITATTQFVSNGNAYVYGGLKVNNINPSGVLNLLSGGASGSASVTGILIRSGAGHITIDASNGGNNSSYYAYVRGGTYSSNRRIALDDNGPSSRCLKKNIVDFTKDEYKQALDLLEDIKIYDYNYKYEIHPKKDQYGFIIDDLLDNKLADKFLYFKDEKATINEKNALDYLVEENEKNYIEFKRYDEETLVKYLLVVCKALQNKINALGKGEHNE